MADISDVQTVLRDIANAAVFPNGTQQPSVANCNVTLGCGWPNADELDTAIAAGAAIVSVFPTTIERNTSRYPREWEVVTPPVTTLTATINGSQVALGGSVASPQNIGIIVNGKAYTHAVQTTDTLPGIAAALASQIAVDVPGTVSSGFVITVPAPARITAARIGGFGTVGMEIRRQERVVCITVWAPTPAIRDTLATTIDVALAQLKFIRMPDSFMARLTYKNSSVVDTMSKETIYRRDLNYAVEYPTTVIEQAAAIIAPSLTIEDSSGTITTNAI